MASRYCDECDKMNPPNHVTQRYEDGLDVFLCIDCYYELEKQQQREIQAHNDHEGMTALLLLEANRRDLSGMVVTERDGWLGSNLGITFTSKRRKGFGPFRKTFSFHLILEGNEIVGVWSAANEVTLEFRQEAFRLPLEQKNIPIAVNQAMTFIASKM